MALKVQRVVGDSGSQELEQLRTNYNNLLDATEALAVAIAASDASAQVKAAFAAYITSVEAGCPKLYATPRIPLAPVNEAKAS